MIESKQNGSLNLIGINFHGHGSAAYQNRSTDDPPEQFIEDSFRIFSKNRIKCVRVTFHWESWELDKTRCHNDLEAIAEAAEKYGILCIYDNHQWECSSWIGYGIGMPNSIMSRYYEKTSAFSQPDANTKKDFWSKWWKNEIKTTDDKDGWAAQLSYLGDIISLLNNRKSTFGFEILNEPEVFELSQYKKVGHYHNYMIKGLRRITNKPLLFCWALPHGAFDNPLLQAQIRPSNYKENVIYDGHSYPPTIARMIYFKLIVFLMGNIPLYMGEFNSGFTDGATITQEQFCEYVKRFKRFGTCGWAFWRWSYVKDQNIPAFNLTKVINNKIQPTSYFIHVMNTLSSNNNNTFPD